MHACTEGSVETTHYTLSGLNICWLLLRGYKIIKSFKDPDRPFFQQKYMRNSYPLFLPFVFSAQLLSGDLNDG